MGLTLLATDSAEANCFKTTGHCMNNAAAMQRTCDAWLLCNHPATFPVEWYVTHTASTNVTQCLPVNSVKGPEIAPGFMLTARAMSSAPPTRSCSWKWRTEFGVYSGFVSITTADGLPVELMDFSIEDDAEPASSETNGE